MQQKVLIISTSISFGDPSGLHERAIAKRVAELGAGWRITPTASPTTQQLYIPAARHDARDEFVFTTTVLAENPADPQE